MAYLPVVLLAVTCLVLGAAVAGAVFRKRAAPAPFRPLEAPAPATAPAVDPQLSLLQEQLRQILDNQAELRGVSEYQLSQVLDSTRILQLEAAKLSGALSNNQIRGNWGEIQLRRSLEVAGMLPHTDFMEQAILENGSKRPDVIVNLPGHKHVIIDSKASMNYYLELIKNGSEGAADTLLSAHARTLKQHVQALSGKEYWKALPQTAEFVVLFVPNDAALAAAVTADATLMEFAAERRIILAGPSTLLSILFAIAQSWRQETASANVEQIGALGLEIYNRLQAMSGPFDEVQKKLDEMQNALKTVRWHMSDRIFVTGRKLQQLTGAPKSLVERDVP